MCKPKRITCENCEHCKIVHDEDLFSKTKCMATSAKGRTMAYHATFCYERGKLLDPMVYLERHLKNRIAPIWCPKRKGELV